MATVREYGKPDYFITVICNPKWPKITGTLLDGQKPNDRQDLESR
ncbi:19049_t:CDS:2 [Dentiscutata erythropus]|uniref:19049_t:CDS:1 n=1 Tax=Dentiscutata erythropus TaxID=1348616 RepID=A0A9N9I1S5_9GLOM|nr:19049_t:CDS:2 [Dentiscutata erythropus]